MLCPSFCFSDNTDGNDLCVHPGGEEGSELFLAISRVSFSFWSSSRQLASWPTRDEMRGGFSVLWWVNTIDIICSCS